jgi:PhzF family phenazine biosynthesis protein
MSSEVLRLAAFTDRPDGGNPAGVVLDAAGMTDAEMLAVAAEVGYSETAFLDGSRVRYFSPAAEVPFCGHATIALGVALGDGDRTFETASGPVRVQVADGEAALTSVPPRSASADEADVDEVLAALGWARTIFGGAWHLLLGIASRGRLAVLDYDFERLRALMVARDWITVALVHRCAETVFDARNAFAFGGVVEDPATGAAAAGFGGYLRELGLVRPPAVVTIHQGDDMGRPSVLVVTIGTEGGIRVSGRAVRLQDPLH